MKDILQLFMKVKSVVFGVNPTGLHVLFVKMSNLFTHRNEAIFMFSSLLLLNIAFCDRRK